MSSSRDDSFPRKASSASSSSSTSKSKRHLKTDDWSEVTEPEERRRIQNRIAQRKFREKTRENKERAEREERNRTHAASSYRIPTPGDLPLENEVSGLPWGGISMAHVVSRGHDSSRTQRSGDSYTGAAAMSGASAMAGAPGLYIGGGGYQAGAVTEGYYGGMEGQEYEYETDRRNTQDLDASFSASVYRVASVSSSFSSSSSSSSSSFSSSWMAMPLLNPRETRPVTATSSFGEW